MVQGILDKAEDCSAEEVADMFELPVEQVRRILLFAYQSELESLAEAHRKRPNLPRAHYYRAGLLVKNVAEITRALRPRPTRKGGTTMTAAIDDPETIYIEPICDRCKNLEATGVWSEEEQEAACMEEDCPNKPRAYIRADLFDAKIDEIMENARVYDDERELFIARLVSLLIRAREATDDHQLFSDIGEALPNLRPPANDRPPR
jgi:hypothetical protein